MIEIRIETDNDAFQPNPAPEVARILRDLAERIERDGAVERRKIYDVNGNTVGTLRSA